MIKFLGAALCLVLFCCISTDCFSEEPKASDHQTDSLINKVKQDYTAWKAKNGDKRTGNVRVDIEASSEFRFNGISTVFGFYSVRLIEQGQGWKGEYLRLLAIALEGTGNPAAFFDTGFFQPECGAEPEMSFGQIGTAQIKRKHVLIIDTIIRPVSCMDVPSQEFVKSAFFTATAPFNKVLEIEREYVNYNNPEDGKTKPVDHRSAYFHPNGCINDNCSFLTVWYSKPKLDVISFTWNSEMTRLVPVK